MFSRVCMCVCGCVLVCLGVCGCVLVCLCVCGCWVGVALIQSCQSSCQDGKWAAAVTLLIVLWTWERRTWTALLSRYINVQSLRRLSVPILVCARGTVKGVWDHFRLLDVLLCYCASEITWRYIFHTRFSSFAQKSPEGIEEFMSGTLLYVGRRKILFLIYINIFSAVKFAVVL